MAKNGHKLTYFKTFKNGQNQTYFHSVHQYTDKNRQILSLKKMECIYGQLCVGSENGHFTHRATWFEFLTKFSKFEVAKPFFFFFEENVPKIFCPTSKFFVKKTKTKKVWTKKWTKIDMF